MADDSMSLLETVRKMGVAGDVDVLREGVRLLAQAIMEAEVTELTGVRLLLQDGVQPVSAFAYARTGYVGSTCNRDLAGGVEHVERGALTESHGESHRPHEFDATARLPGLQPDLPGIIAAADEHRIEANASAGERRGVWAKHHSRVARQGVFVGSQRARRGRGSRKPTGSRSHNDRHCQQCESAHRYASWSSRAPDAATCW
jgi:hypothetical protein